MRTILRYIRNHRFQYDPLIEVTISKENILSNLRYFQSLFKKSAVAPVLKSNAYGHGLVGVAKILDPVGLPFFVVDSFHEALILRNERIKTPILVIGFTRTEHIAKNRLKKVSFTITSLEQLKALSRSITSPTVFHLKIDTGMGRQGIRIDELEMSAELIKNNPNFLLVGIASHFADADNLNEIYTKDQIQRWNEVVLKAKTVFPNLTFFHISNTSGYFYENLVNANVARVGIGLYGIRLNVKRDAELVLLPALQMKSIISGVKMYERGDKIGYNGTFEAKDKMVIATLPLGYYEGLDRRLSNKGFVEIKNIFCPIVGRVSLNITSVDVTNVKNPQIGDEVTVISNNPKERNSLENIAKICDTTPYDILAHIPSQIRRNII
ncbi:MAG: alanine racemase [Candidatus Taylorbacteria bacterium]